MFHPIKDSETKMKKILLVLSVSILLGLALSSCHAYEECPAYGEIDTSTTDEING